MHNKCQWEKIYFEFHESFVASDIIYGETLLFLTGFISLSLTPRAFSPGVIGKRKFHWKGFHLRYARSIPLTAQNCFVDWAGSQDYNDDRYPSKEDKKREGEVLILHICLEDKGRVLFFKSYRMQTELNSGLDGCWKGQVNYYRKVNIYTYATLFLDPLIIHVWRRELATKIDSRMFFRHELLLEPQFIFSKFWV